MRLKVPVARVFVPLLAPARYKGAKGGRGSAKSHFFADMLVTRCVSKTTRAVCIREIQKSIKKSVKQLIEDKIRDRGLGHLFYVTDTFIEVIAGAGKGGRIDFEGMQNHTADSIKSLEGYDIAWVEEAQSLSQRSLNLLRPTIRKAGSELWFSWNPEKPTDPIEALLCGETPPRGAVVVHANFSDNPWFPQELRDEMEVDRERDPDLFAHVWMGQYKKVTGALVFKRWKIQAFDTPADAVHRAGADWGFGQDPTVLIRAFVGDWVDGKAKANPNGRVLFVDAEAHGVGVEIDDTPALFAGNDNHKPARWTNDNNRPGVPGAHKMRITADSARPETISYMRRRGFNIQPAIKGPGSVEDGVSFLKAFDIVVHPNCKNAGLELASYSFEVDKVTEEVTSKLEDKNNHVIDALRYALENLRRTGFKPGGAAKAPPRRSDYGENDHSADDDWRAA